METFQKIYRPEIYNANAAAGSHHECPFIRQSEIHGLSLRKRPPDSSLIPET